jgi:thymidylate synthase
MALVISEALIMQTYLDLLREVRDSGKARQDRTGTGTRSVFGRQIRFDLRDGFPLVTTKRVHIPSVVHELLWFLQGDSNVGYLQANKVKIWDAWADPDTGDLGPVYGVQWRSWPTPNGNTVDQISQVIEQIQMNPESRRLLVSAWNVAEIPRMALPPCHVMFQFYVEPPFLHLQLYQRSADIFLGVPFNIASYSLLLSMVAQVTGYRPGQFIHTFGDLHIYENHLEQVDIQLGRQPLDPPTLELNTSIRSVFDFGFDDIAFHGYSPHATIRAPIAV